MSIEEIKKEIVHCQETKTGKMVRFPEALRKDIKKIANVSDLSITEMAIRLNLPASTLNSIVHSNPKKKKSIKTNAISDDSIMITNASNKKITIVTPNGFRIENLSISEVKVLIK